MKKIYYFLVLIVALVISSCQGGNVDVKQTQKPTLLVIPSDQLLSQYGALKNQFVDGEKQQVRDYSHYLLTDDNSKFIISSIQQSFIKFGYPLGDLEQSIKSINDKDLIDEATGIKKDARTVLLTNAKPDIILELDYNLATDRSSEKRTKKLTYTIRAIDSFTNKVVATMQETGKTNEDDNTAQGIMAKALEDGSSDFVKQINDYFDDIVKNGRDITVRVTIADGESLQLSDNGVEGDTYSDFIIDYMKAHTLQGAYNMQRNTDTELYFVNVRVQTLNDNGTQYSAYDFARELSKELNKKQGLNSKNISQGLGEATIMIKGM